MKSKKSEDLRCVRKNRDDRIGRWLFSAGIAVMTILSILICSFPMTADYSPGWGVPELIEHQDESGSYPQIAMDDHGNAMAVWYQRDPISGRRDIWANRYEPATGWEEPTLIDTRNDGWGSDPQIAMDNNGNAMAVWRLNDTQTYNIWSNRYKVGLGWGYNEKIEQNDSGDALFPQIAMDEIGNAIAVWQYNAPPAWNISANRYDAATGSWGDAIPIENDDIFSYYEPQIAMDNNGNGIAVFYCSTDYYITVNRYVIGLGWEGTTVIDNKVEGAFDPQIAMNDNGDAMVAWTQWNDSYSSIFACRYLAGTGWEAPERIEDDDTGDVEYPQVALDNNGNAAVVWQHYAVGFFDIWANYYTPGTGWGTETLLETDDSGDASGQQVAMDNDGNAMAVWHQYNDTGWVNIYGRLYESGAGWDSLSLLETKTGDAELPQIAGNDQGIFMTVWRQYPGAGFFWNIWANRYEPYDNTPPPLKILSPADGTVTENSTIPVSGETEPSVELIINGIVVDVDANGDFEFVLALSEGPNLIEATATDEAGNPTTKSVTVTYENPVHELEEELEETKEELEETKNELNETKEGLNTTQNQLNNTQEDLETTWNQLNDTDDDLADTKDDLETTKTELETTKTDLTTAQTDLTDTQNELEETKKDVEAAEDSVGTQTIITLMLPIMVLVVLLVVIIMMYLSLKKKIGRAGPLRSEDDIPYQEEPRGSEVPRTAGEELPPPEDIEKPGPVPEEELPPPED